MKGTFTAHLGETRHGHLSDVAKVTHPTRSGLGNKTAFVEEVIDKAHEQYKQLGEPAEGQYEIEVTLRRKVAC